MIAEVMFNEGDIVPGESRVCELGDTEDKK